MSWQTVIGHGEPVRGDVDLFHRTERNWRDAGTKAEVLKTEFGRILDRTDDPGLRGQAADAFRSIVRETKVDLDDVPKICWDIASILAVHACQLLELRAAANRALARAQTAWDDAAHHSRRRDDANARVARVQAQIRSLQGYPPEQVEPQMQTLRSNESIEIRSCRRAEADLAGAQRRLNTERDEWQRLHDLEQCLNKQTDGSLSGVDLHNGWFERQLHSVVDFVGDYYLENPFGMLLAIVRGDYEQLLWLLRDQLEHLSTLLTIATVVVALVGAVVVVATAATGVGIPVALAAFATFGAAIVALGAVQAGVSALQARVTRELWVRQSIDSRTGRQLGLYDVGVDYAMATISVAGAAVGGGAAAQVAGRATPSVTRFLAREAGVPLLETGRDAAIQLVADVGQSGLQQEVSGGSNVEAFLVGAEDRRDVLIHRQLEQVRSSNRGLSSRCRVRLVPCGAR